VILLIDTNPAEPKTLMELKTRKIVKPAAAPETLQDRVAAAFSEQEAAGSSRERTSGAAEAVGVSTAADEDDEEAEEAELPHEFDYYSDEHQQGEEEK